MLVVDDLRVSFPNRDGGTTEAVRGVSFALGRERLGIVGESGSGKTQTGARSSASRRRKAASRATARVQRRRSPALPPRQRRELAADASRWCCRIPSSR
jgi:peptide/nickel transport system ATP-binding protein